MHKILSLAAVLFASFQSANPSHSDSFEVTAIHLNRSGSGNTQIELSHPGRFVAVNASARTLLRNAYDLLPFQLSGAPRWDEEDKFDIQATLGSTDRIT